MPRRKGRECRECVNVVNIDPMLLRNHGSHDIHGLLTFVNSLPNGAA